MKRQDLIFILIILTLILPFVISHQALSFYMSFNKSHGIIMSFIKFAILATIGETIGQRIKSGSYINPTFGLLPKAIVWGFLGITIKAAFIIFATGVPMFIEYLGFNNIKSHMLGELSIAKVAIAFSISVAMNITYAPIMMLFHKITDAHITTHKGKLNSLTKPINFNKILNEIDWEVQWGFVFKKTIPLFWFPAHTITFLLPPDYQVLFAATLSIMLGLILALASLKNKK